MGKEITGMPAETEGLVKESQKEKSKIKNHFLCEILFVIDLKR